MILTVESWLILLKRPWDILHAQFEKKTDNQQFRKTLEIITMTWSDREDAPPSFQAQLKNQMREFDTGLASRNFTTIKESEEIGLAGSVPQWLRRRTPPVLVRIAHLPTFP